MILLQKQRNGMLTGSVLIYLHHNYVFSMKEELCHAFKMMLWLAAYYRFFLNKVYNNTLFYIYLIKSNTCRLCLLRYVKLWEARSYRSIFKKRVIFVSFSVFSSLLLC